MPYNAIVYGRGASKRSSILHIDTKRVKGFPMSIFSKILDKLGLRKEKQEEKPAATGTTGTASAPRKPTATAPNPKTSAPAKPAASARPAGTASRPTAVSDRDEADNISKRPVTTAAAPPKAMSEVDVMTMLEQKAKGTGLNWKQSISDLLFLLDMDNSYEARVELAKELNAPQEVMGDSARMNTWLHKEVLRKIAENGGNIPQELLD
jgi:hypothetical protein